MLFEHHDLKPRNPYLSLALDEALCMYLACKDGTMPFHGGLRLWTNPYAIILGRTCKPQKVIHSQSPQSISDISTSSPTLPICRRLSGGGTVLHGPGNLNYSVFLSLEHYPEMYNLKHSYNVLLNMIKDALGAQGIDCIIKGQSDLVLLRQDGSLRKISGNAQFRRYNILVLHGTLITRLEFISQVKKYLAHPPKEPLYRAGRKHEDFIGHLPSSFDFSAFYLYFSKRLIQLTKGQSLIPLTASQRHFIYRQTHRLVNKQYTKQEWIFEGKTLQLS